MRWRNGLRRLGGFLARNKRAAVLVVALTLAGSGNPIAGGMAGAELIVSGAIEVLK